MTSTMSSSHLHPGSDVTPAKSNNEPAPIPVPASLDELVALLHAELGSNGLDSEHVDVDRVKKLMSNYVSNKGDWQKYALFDKNRYTRNLVDDGNVIHDHSGAHCIMKILDGELQETLYDWPDKVITESDHSDSGVGSDHSDNEEQSKPMKITRETILHRDECAYMSDQLGLHRVSNPLKGQGSLSLHLYTPPYETCKTFNERSSKARSSGKCVFYSTRGEKLESCPSKAYLECPLTIDDQ
ncbi:hypothetical protein BGZ54_003132 [Gamsiella multidivaricata]|nr:hypothetical protein BGZ54_003132 [Gamsiella multidivaricata]